MLLHGLRMLCIDRRRWAALPDATDRHGCAGDGGNVEGTYKDFVDTMPPQNCSVPLSELNAPGGYTPLCATAEMYPPTQNRSYCPITQPFYSAYR